MFVIANRRILHHQIQEKGSTFEVDNQELETLLERQLVTLVQDKSQPMTDGVEDTLKPMAMEPENHSALTRPAAVDSDQISQTEMVAGIAGKSFIKVDSKRLNRQIKGIAKRKEMVFAEENVLFDREKNIERLNAALARKEETIQARLKAAEKTEIEIQGANTSSQDPGNNLLVRSPMR